MSLLASRPICNRIQQWEKVSSLILTRNKYYTPSEELKTLEVAQTLTGCTRWSFIVSISPPCSTVPLFSTGPQSFEECWAMPRILFWSSLHCPLVAAVAYGPLEQPVLGNHPFSNLIYTSEADSFSEVAILRWQLDKIIKKDLPPVLILTCAPSLLIWISFTSFVIFHAFWKVKIL